MVLPILLYPDELLRRPGRLVASARDPEVQGVIDDLVDTMLASPGCVGLAAPQVNRDLQVLVCDCGLARRPTADHHGLLVMCNPQIQRWAGQEVGREGCLSLPDYTGNVVRAVEMAVRFLDRSGEFVTLTLCGYEARVVQHEMDHLEGKLFIDRVISRKADLFPRKKYLPHRRDGSDPVPGTG